LANSDAACYGGGGIGNGGGGWTEDEPAHGFAQSVRLTLPPLAALLLKAG
jgi:1,4-alpha-glucan branching enzyme